MNVLTHVRERTGCVNSVVPRLGTNENESWGDFWLLAPSTFVLHWRMVRGWSISIDDRRVIREKD